MNTNKFIQAFNNGIYSDLELVLKDNKNEIKMKIHKLILWTASDFFEKYMANESGSSILEMNVKNAVIASDIISSFYDFEPIYYFNYIISTPKSKKLYDNSILKKENYPEWKYHIEYMIICDYFCLDYDWSILQDINIPGEGLTLLLENIYLLPDDYKVYKLIDKLTDNFNQFNFLMIYY